MAKLTLKDVIAIMDRDRQFIDGDLVGLYLGEMNLSGANFSSAKLGGADLTQSDLSHVNFSSADLTNVNFNRANLTGVILRDANLSAAKFSPQPQLRDATLPDGQRYKLGTDMTQYTGPDSAIHVTVYKHASSNDYIIEKGTPDAFGATATTVEWMSKGEVDVLLHICNIFLNDNQLAEIANRAIG